MIVGGESSRENVARTKGLASAVKYHGIMINDEEICCRILRSIAPHMHFVREGFALRIDNSLAELEHTLVKVGELKKQLTE